MKGKCLIVDGEYFYNGTISRILNQVGMRPKVIVSNKDEVTIRKLGDTFLGYKWRIQEDVILLSYNVNTIKKRQGIRTSPFITKETLAKLEKTDLTISIVTGVWPLNTIPWD